MVGSGTHIFSGPYTFDGHISAHIQVIMCRASVCNYTRMHTSDFHTNVNLCRLAVEDALWVIPKPSSSTPNNGESDLFCLGHVFIDGERGERYAAMCDVAS